MARFLALAAIAVLVAVLCGCASARPVINVHVVAHTHDDVGWLKTVDQYYVGMNESIQDAGVQYIIDEVVDALIANPARKFIYVEIAFFYRWWQQQTPYRQDQVRQLVDAGQLEFINGGWCMNDEANVDYTAIIDQMTDGHQFLLNEFGVRPRIGWHVDPFGHANTQASIFAQMGFDAFFPARIDYDDKANRYNKQTLEFVWQGSQSLGTSSEIFTHVLYNDYCYPRELTDAFSWEWGADPVQDDPRLNDYNAEVVAEAMMNTVEGRYKVYRTPNIMFPLGCDFQFQNNFNYKNMDKLIAYVNANQATYGLNVFYSTPSMYIDYVNAANLSWTLNTDDFFPYASDPYAIWSGYFTSRSALKGYVRSRTALLHLADSVLTTAATAAINTTDALLRIQKLSYAHSVAQHHDAVAGTEKQHVADDYAQRLAIGSTEVEGFLAEAFSSFVNPQNHAAPSFQFCPLLNQSLCPALSAFPASAIPIVAYNHLGWTRTENFRLPINTQSVQVVGANGSAIPSQVYANPDLPGTFVLAFSATIPPVGFTTFVLQAGSGEYVETTKMVEDSTISNQYYSLEFSANTGRLSSIQGSGTPAIMVDQNYFWWNASAGNNVNSTRASGAYAFRSNGTQPFVITSAAPTTTVTTGPVVSEVRQVFSPWVSSIIRLWAGSNRIEAEATIGPIDISDGQGKEIISKWSTSLNTSQLWWTDSEGGEYQRRQLNYRPTWTLNVTDPVSLNYYPMNYGAFIQDSTASIQFTVLTDRSRGASSLNNGELETMLHRRLLYDDQFGVGEPLNETTVIRTKQYVEVATPAQSARLHRADSFALNNPVLLAFSTAANAQTWLSTYTPTYTALAQPLPANVHLLTLKTMPDGRVLLRLNHIFAAGEDAQLSQPASVDVSTLFANLTPTSMDEMTLTANRPLSELNRLQWNVDGLSGDKQTAPAPLKDFVVTLGPQQIRTFLVRFDSK